MRKRAASIFTREDALLEAFVLEDLLQRELFKVLATDLWLLGADWTDSTGFTHRPVVEQ